jgi:protein LSM14
VGDVVVLFLFLSLKWNLVRVAVKYFGTEDRPAEKKVAGNDSVLAFVSFPGNEIKDLYVHEGDESAPTEEQEAPKQEEALPTPPVQNGPPAVPQTNKPRAPRQQQQQQQQQQHQQQQQQQQRNNNSNNNNRNNNKKTSAVGTGAHLLHLRERTNNGAGGGLEKAEGEFDFEGALTSFKKEEVLAEVASEQSGVQVESCYKKDNFFDMLSSNSLDDQSGVRRERLTAGQERVLNQDTFGAIALQQNNRYRYGGRGRGGGKGGGRGGGKGRGNGRGGYNSRNNNYNNNNYNNSNNHRQNQNRNPVETK